MMSRAWRYGLDFAGIHGARYYDSAAVAIMPPHGHSAFHFFISAPIFPPACYVPNGRRSHFTSTPAGCVASAQSRIFYSLDADDSRALELAPPRRRLRLLDAAASYGCRAIRASR